MKILKGILILFCAAPTAIFTYYLFGIVLAGAVGGRFYSVPFGGASVAGSNDVGILASLIFWELVWFGVFFAMMRKMSRSSAKDRADKITRP